MQQYVTIESAKYDPKTQTMEWKGKTKEKYSEKSSFESILQSVVCPITFFDKDDRPIGKGLILQLDVGRRDMEGHYNVYFTLKITEEVLNKATSFQVGRQ